MGNPSNFFSDFENATQVTLWKEIVNGLARRYIGEQLCAGLSVTSYIFNPVGIMTVFYLCRFCRALRPAPFW